MNKERNPFTNDITCATNPILEFHQALAEEFGETEEFGATPCFNTACDDPKIRDQTKKMKRKLRVAFTVWNDQLSKKDLELAITAFEHELARIDIVLEVKNRQFVKTNTSTCLPPYDGTMDWYNELMTLKSQYAIDAGNTLNIFVGCQQSGPQGTLLGIATFPWDPLALTPYGGLWMNQLAMSPDDSTLIHEFGHCVGLWHVFHGVDEVQNCQPDSNVCGRTCCEYPHELHETTSAHSNSVGDLCSDTSAAPRHWKCGQPDGVSCTDDKWTEYGPTDYENYMGYSMHNAVTGATEHCQDRFSAQQQRRVACYLDTVLMPYQ
eukprot:CAMPEP_0168589664 /NCGR_PEP_ID=MMETSP0420-20121227/6134_1 /TAXON_ID=498008 /ORGANISM="Pessonella sp." /LENGTH=320 /DNA_ID=CAMNT_0008625229 /DNA_START=169 /DNA_END=1131 /DNA_ORIENTATION=-